MYAKARQYFPEGADHVQDCWLLEELIAQKGKPAAVHLVSQWEAEAKKRYVDPYNLAAMRFAIGDEEGTFRYLHKAYDERSPSLAMLKVEPFFQPTWDRPAYQDLLRAMNLLR